MPVSRALASGLAGVALGVVGTLAVSAGVSRPPAPVAEEAEERRPVAASRPGLAPAPIPPAPPPEEPAAVLSLDLSDWIRHGVAQVRKGEANPPSLWPLIAAVYARLGRADDVERACATGLAAGGKAAECTLPLSQLPERERVRVFNALRARAADLVWDPRLVLQAATAQGDTRAVFEAALVVFKGAGQGSFEAFEEMVRLDPWSASRAADEYRARESGFLARISQAFAKAGERARAAEWAALAAARSTEEFARVQAQVAEQKRLARERAGRDPHDADSWADLARMLEEDGDRSGAADAYRRALEIDPFREDDWRALVRVDAAGAIPLLQAAAPRLAIDALWVCLANACLRTGRGPEAMDAFEHVHSGDLQDWWHFGFARAAPERALAWLERRLQSPRFAAEETYLRGRADALLAAGRRTAAWDAFARVAEFDVLAGWIGWTRADPARALEVLDARLREDKDDSAARFARAEALRLLGRREAALEEYARLAEEGDDEAGALAAGLGSAAWLAKTEQGAREAGGDPWTQLRLAEAYRALGREDDARRALASVEAAVEGDAGWWIRRWFPR